MEEGALPTGVKKRGTGKNYARLRVPFAKHPVKGTQRVDALLSSSAIMTMINVVVIINR